MLMRVIILLAAAFALTQTAAAQTPAEIKASLPQVAGWTVNETVEVFDPDNLYERINGAAPGYILFDFREMTAFEYNKSNAGDNPQYITVQVYRHASREDAFGIYASERPSETVFITAGAEGYQEGSMLNFFVDDLYVKIESPFADEGVVSAVKQIAQGLGGKINPAPVFPARLQSFPAENKIVRSELYIAAGFLGHEFLNKVFTASYEAAGKKYQLFIKDTGSAEQARATLTQYLQFTKQNLQLKEGRLTIKDRFNGDVECLWSGQYLLGIVNDSNAPVKVDEILTAVAKRL